MRTALLSLLAITGLAAHAADLQPYACDVREGTLKCEEARPENVTGVVYCSGPTVWKTAAGGEQIILPRGVGGSQPTMLDEGTGEIVPSALGVGGSRPTIPMGTGRVDWRITGPCVVLAPAGATCERRPGHVTCTPTEELGTGI